MSSQSLVIGKTNAGKTLFCVNFAKYLGVRELRWWVEKADGRREERRMSFTEAERTLSDALAHRTRELQSLYVDVPMGKGVRSFMLTDTTGLSEGIHTDVQVRDAMAQTLRSLLDAQIVLHVVDATALTKNTSATNPSSGLRLTELDEQLIAFGSTRQSYLILANKMDMPGAKQGYQLLCKHFPKQRVIPVSARNLTGFREVKRHVWRLA